jgi:hypothetical protein
MTILPIVVGLHLLSYQKQTILPAQTAKDSLVLQANIKGDYPAVKHYKLSIKNKF